ncbi:MAG: hypothetical protein Q7V31_12190 [Parvibaculum sp.]|uniref:hypothetical protein n=1 Tax=Parvibaculum sp. TaxID=2024848 RepID=UPI00271FFD1B|nr:hypothetical protein [Parvibaculum sp.]MDO8839677.1 hypothetical protein [Parvibaculum sp.]
MSNNKSVPIAARLTEQAHHLYSDAELSALARPVRDIVIDHGRLVAFFRSDAGAVLGREGDNLGLTPANMAIRAMLRHVADAAAAAADRKNAAANAAANAADRKAEATASTLRRITDAEAHRIATEYVEAVNRVTQWRTAYTVEAKRRMDEKMTRYASLLSRHSLAYLAYPLFKEPVFGFDFGN